MRRQKIRPRLESSSRAKDNSRSPVLLFVCVLIMVACGITVSLVYSSLSRSDFFQITEIVIQGTDRLQKKDVFALSGVDINSNLLQVKKSAIREKLMANGWIAGVEVSKNWPNQLLIIIRERHPIAMLNRDDALSYMDKTGRIFARVQPRDDHDYPVISIAGDKGADDPVLVNKLTQALLFLKQVAHGNTSLPGQNISEVRVTADQDLILFLTDNPFPIFLGKGGLREKYYRLGRVLTRLYDDNDFKKTAYIRMDYRDHEVLVGFTEENDNESRRRG